MYDYSKRTILVFRNYAPTVKCVVRSVLHEYAHYLQNLRWYGNVLNKVGYMKHPQEIEARGMECLELKYHLQNLLVMFLTILLCIQ